MPETTPDQARSPEKQPLENRKDAYIDEGGPRENAGRNSGFAMARGIEMKDHRVSNDSNAPYFGPPKSKLKMNSLKVMQPINQSEDEGDFENIDTERKLTKKVSF